jgi:hypothetical protein
MPCTSATRIRRLPHLTVELTLTCSLLKPSTLEKVVATVPEPVTTSCAPPPSE